MIRSFRLSLRFLLPLLLAILAVAYLSIPLVDALMQRWFVRDLDLRASLIARSFEEPVGDLLEAKIPARIDALLERATVDERLFALAICDAAGQMLHKTRSFPPSVNCNARDGARGGIGFLLESPRGPLHVSTADLKRSDGNLVTLLMLHDMSFIQRRSEDTRKYILLLFTVLGVVIALITIVVAQSAGAAGFRRACAAARRRRDPADCAAAPGAAAAGCRTCARCCATCEDERREQDAMTVEWSPKRCGGCCDEQFAGDEVIVVSNREPYIHDRSDDGDVRCKRPASGLVTAVEPVMRACSGTWIAHGSGSADRESVDASRPLARAAGEPGVHAAAHLAHRGGRAGLLLRLRQRRAVAAVPRRARAAGVPHAATGNSTARSTSGSPMRWSRKRTARIRSCWCRTITSRCCRDDPRAAAARDDHHVLAHPLAEPRVVRHLPVARRDPRRHAGQHDPRAFTRATTARTFFETVDRFVEARIEHESSTISFGGHLTLVEATRSRSSGPTPLASEEPIEAARARIRAGLGVGRRSPARARRRPARLHQGHRRTAAQRSSGCSRSIREWVGRFTFVQIAAPSRSSLDEYSTSSSRSARTADEINQRFGAPATGCRSGC